MGMSASAYLSYGVDIGSEDDSFGFDYDDPNKPAWTEEGAYDTIDKTCREHGLSFVLYGTYDSSGYLIVAGETASACWGAERVTWPLAPKDAAERISRALESLGFDPAKHTPGWYLSALYG